MNMNKLKNSIWLPVLLIPVWYLIYRNLVPMTDWLIFSVLGMTKGAFIESTAKLNYRTMNPLLFLKIVSIPFHRHR